MNLKLTGLLGLVVVVVVSQAVEQVTKGAYSTPPLLGDLAKLAVGALFSVEGLARLSALWGNRPKDKDPTS
jgi:hypothetical protein